MIADISFTLDPRYKDEDLRLAKVVEIRLCIFEVSWLDLPDPLNTACPSIDVRVREAADSA